MNNGIEGINAAVGAPIESVMLGRGAMPFGGKAVEIGTRLVIGLDESWLVVFNALDENG